MRRLRAIISLSFFEQTLGRLKFPLRLAAIWNVEARHRLTGGQGSHICGGERNSYSSQSFELPGLEGISFPLRPSSPGKRIRERIRRVFSSRRFI